MNGTLMRTSIFVVDDSDDHWHFLKEELEAEFPACDFKRFEDPLSAYRATGSPKVLLLDMSAIGSIYQPEHCYAPICSLLGKYPGAVVLINTAMGARTAEGIADDVRERCPESVVKCVDWSDASPTKSIIELIKESI